MSASAVYIGCVGGGSFVYKIKKGKKKKKAFAGMVLQGQPSAAVNGAPPSVQTMSIGINPGCALTPMFMGVSSSTQTFTGGLGNHRVGDPTIGIGVGGTGTFCGGSTDTLMG